MYQRMLDSAVRRQDWKDAESWIGQIRESGGNIGSKFLLPHIEAWLGGRRGIAEGKFWVKQALIAGEDVNATTIESVLRPMLRDWRWKDAEQWLVEAGLDPLPYLNATGRMETFYGFFYSNVVHDYRRAEERLEQLLSVKGIREEEVCTERVISFLIVSAISAGLFERADHWFGKAASAGTRVKTETMNYIIREAAKKGLSEAEVWFGKACLAGFDPDVKSFTAVINAATHDEDAQAAERWYNRSIQMHVAPDAVTFKLLMNQAARRRDLAGAERWFAAAEEAGVDVDIRCYNALISTAAGTGNFALTEKWFERVRKDGLEPNLMTFSTFIAAAMKAARPQRVEELFWEMLGFGIQPDSTILGTMRFALGRGKLSQLCQEAELDFAAVMQEASSHG